MPVIATWRREEEFEVGFPGGERIVLASLPAEQRPGPGPGPMDAVQAALAGCTGVDVVSILAKMRKTLKSLRIQVDATRREEQPRIYTRLHLTYHVDGPDLDPASVTRAVRLSQDKYCSVAAMLRPAVDLSWGIVLNGEELPAPPGEE